MADVNANIGVNIDTSNALAQLKALQRQISQFHTSIAKSSETASLAQRDLQRNFINGVNAIGAFSAELRTIKTTAESFTDSLEKNKFSMREYFRFAGASTKTFGKLFKSEFDTINKVAEENVKRLSTQYIKMGRDASGAMRAIAIIPNELDMSSMSTQLQIAAQRQALFNQLVRQGSTNLLNFGKNTQWAGRQLMVGFTLPLATLGVTASRVFMDMETAALKFRKVYGDLFTPAPERQQAFEDIVALGEVFTRYGIAVADTVNLAADAAAAGFQGADLQRQVTEATRLQVLGQIEQQKALETTISLQNAFRLSNEDLSDSINFLNAVENQTVVSLDDITTAIPKVAPVIMQLGGNVRDLAFFLTAMKQGGVNASEGANALKSGLAALINPTEKASDMLKGMGINIKEIVETNQGNLRATVIEFAKALDTLDPLTRARAIEQLFGKFQFARLSTLFENVTAGGTQAARVLDLAGYSAEELASIAESELGMTAESGMNKFRAAVESLRLALIPVGESFLEAVTPIVQFIGGILEKFNNLSAGVKKAIVVLTVAIGAIGPVALMTFGLLANGLANILKGALILRQGYLRLTGQSQILGEQTQFLTAEQMNAAAVAHSLDQSHARLTQTFNAEAGAVNQLVLAYQAAARAGANFAMQNPAMMRAPRARGYAKGGEVFAVPGTGNQDTVPAMLTPGEIVVPKRQSKKYAPLIQGIIADNIPGYKKGTGIERAHATMPFASGSEQFEAIFRLIPELRRLNDQFPGIIRVVSNLTAELPLKLNQAMKEITTRSGRVVGGVSTDRFTAEYESLQDKFAASAMRGGANIDNPSVRDAVRRFEVAVGERAVAIAKGTEKQKVTDTIFAEATNDVIQEFKLMDAESKQVAEALDRVGQQIGQIRIQPSQAQYREGLARGLFSVDPSGQVAKFGNVEVARPTAPTKAGLPAARPASNINLPGNYTGGRDLSTSVSRQATQVANEAILATATAAGTQSPSRRTIPIGEDIARGLSVGMMNQADDVAQTGQQVATQAIRGVSRGARTQGPVTPGTNFPVEKTRGGVSMTQVANAAILSQATKDSAENMVKSAKSFQDRMTTLNRGLMSGTFALGSLSGLASFSGGKLGEFAGVVSKLNLAMFALMSVTQLLTQTQFTKLAADRVGLAQAAIANAHAAGAIKLSGRSGLLGSFSRLIVGIKAFLGPIGLAATAFAGTVTIIRLVNAARERERLAIEGLGDAALLTKDKLKTLGDFFGVVPQTTPLERTGPSLIVNTETRTKLDELRQNQDFLNQFKNDINALRQATTEEAQLIFNSLAVQLKGKGFAKEQINLILKALQEESGKVNLNLDFANIDLKTAEGQAELKASIKQLGESLGKDFATGYTSETNTAVSRATGEVVTWTEETLSKDLKKTVSTTSKVLAGILNGISGQLANGTITAKEFDQSFQEISTTISGMPQPQAALLLREVFKNLPGDLAKSVAGLKNTSDQLMLVEAAMLGVTTITPAMIAALKIAETSLDGGAQRTATRVRAKIRQDIKDLKEIRELVAKELGTVTGGGDGEKSAYQKAIEELKEQRKQLIQSQDAFAKLQKAGVETGRAFEIASNPILAAAIATTKVGTPEWEKLLKLIKDVNRELLSSELLKFFESRTAEIDLKKQFAEILPLLEQMGLNAEDIKAIFANPDLARAFIKDLQDGVLNSKELAKYIEQIPEMKRIDIILGITEDDAEAELKRKADELFGFLERAVEREYKTQIIDAEKEVEAAQDAVDKIQNTIDGYEREIESKQRATELELSRPIEAFQEQVSDLQRTMEMNFERPIEELNKQIGLIERQIEISFDRPIAGLQADIEAMQRSIELGFERPIAALQEEASDLSNELELIDRAAQEINDKYDAQEEALQKINDINEQISSQQKSQLSIADALSQGDIAAAAQAAQQARADAVQAAQQRASGTIDAARQSQLDALRTRQGMTRVQIEQRQFVISQQVFALEEQREAVQAKILIKQDQIYALEQSRIPLQEQIRIKQDQIYAKQKEQELVQLSIRDIEDKIYALEELREANLIQIRDLEDAVYNIKNGINVADEQNLLLAQQKLTDAQNALQVVKDELQARLDNIEAQKDAWQAAADAEMAAKILAGEYNDVLEATKAKLASILEYWKQIAAAMAKANAGIGSTGAVTTIPKVTVKPDTKKDEKQDKAVKDNTEKIKEEIVTLTELRKETESGTAINHLLKEHIDALNDSLKHNTEKITEEIVTLTELRKETETGTGINFLLKEHIDTLNDSLNYNPPAVIVDEQTKFREQQNQFLNVVVERLGEVFQPKEEGVVGRFGEMGYESKGGFIKPKYMSVGGLARGTDKIPAMLTPGEFIMNKYAVSSYGVDRLSAINSGKNTAEGVYNYSVNVNVKSGSNPEEIARAVMTQIKQIDSQRIRGQRVS